MINICNFTTAPEFTVLLKLLFEDGMSAHRSVICGIRYCKWEMLLREFVLLLS